MGGLAGFGSWGLAQWDAWEGCGVDAAGKGGHVVQKRCPKGDQKRPTYHFIFRALFFKSIGF